MVFMFPIFIPSKGRPRNKTADGMAKEGLDFTLLVEPYEAEAYAANYGADKVVAVSRENAGEAFARNAIKFIAIKNKQAYNFQIDDDISGFRIGIAWHKNRKATFKEALQLQEDESKKIEHLGVSSAITASFPYGGKGSLLNKSIQSCLLVNSYMPIYFRHVPTYGPLDIDLAIQCMHNGWRTLRCTQVMYYGPVQTGKTMQGGNCFTPETRNETYRTLARAWPQYMTFNEKRPNLSTSTVWKHFKNL
jgi:hypothetical protein